MQGMTIILDNLPANVDKTLHQKAAVEGRSVQEVAAEAVARGLGVTGGKDESPVQRDLSDIVGTWVDDSEFDAAMRDFERIDPE